MLRVVEEEVELGYVDVSAEVLLDVVYDGDDIELVEVYG